MSVTAAYTSALTVVETLADSGLNTSKNNLQFDKLNTSKSLSGGTTPAASVHANLKVLLSSGAATIDLTALVGTNGATVSGDGLKVRMIKFINNAGNANTMALVTGASNGYALAGASWKLTLPPGGEALIYMVDSAPAISSSAKTIDVSGTGAQELDVEIVMG